MFGLCKEVTIDELTVDAASYFKQSIEDTYFVIATSATMKGYTFDKIDSVEYRDVAMFGRHVMQGILEYYRSVMDVIKIELNNSKIDACCNGHRICMVLQELPQVS